jgi:hypothetical protein
VSEILAYVAAALVGPWGVAHAIPTARIVAGDPDSAVTSWVCRVVAGLLVALAVPTGLTGARTPVIRFKVCPVLRSTSAVLLLVASS